LTAALPGALWTGPALVGLPLATAERQEFRTRFTDKTRLPEVDAVLRLRYELPTGESLQDEARSVEIEQSRTRLGGYTWGFVEGETAREGTLYSPIYASRPRAKTGYAVINGIYVTIRASNLELLLQAARSLSRA
jgi:hypothetical protein